MEPETPPEEDRATHEKLIKKLTDAGIEFTVTEHEPVKTSEEAAEIRGVSLDSGAKAMLFVDSSRK